MKMVKNLSVANIRKYEGFERREDLDFSDDGNYFRGFAYKGMPITTLRSGDTTYLSIRVDYLENEFTHKEWMQTEEYSLTDKFNGVSEFDMDELVETVEKIIAKVSEMNEAAKNEIVNVAEIKTALTVEIEYAEQVVENFKKNFKWYEASEYKLKSLVKYLKSEEQEIANAKNLLSQMDVLERRVQKRYAESLKSYGYVKIRKKWLLS